MSLSQIFIQTLNVTLPVFAMVFLGIAMRRGGWVDDHFIRSASTIVFKGCMPALIFVSIVRADLSQALRPGMITYFGVATVLSFVLCWLWAIWRVPEADRGVYVQGAFRGNCGIMGLALASSMYGDFGLSAGSILVGEVILLYNGLSVIVLTWYQPGQRASWARMTRGVLGNPLILATLVAIVWAVLALPVPVWIMTSADYFADMTLPLALICIGGSLSVAALYEARSIALSAGTIKMTILPGLATLGALPFGFSDAELGLMFLYFACPTASASFIMVQAMGGNVKLAANMVAVTTLAASVTMTLGVFVLRAGGVI
ncbi:AEC family transporter [Salinisphaera sp. T31B1]|uniref:AEC family transporter n=1 Tax=Salinisphaera sp. T31B1 TaxID=727963 RepID=UPI00334074D4